MTTPVWEPGTIYVPGSLVRPSAFAPPSQTPPANADFEDGDTGWTKGTGWSIGASHPFQGAYAAQFNANTTSDLVSNTTASVFPGTQVSVRCQVQQGASSSGHAGAWISIEFLDASDVVISRASSPHVTSGSGGAWTPTSISTVAPAGAAKARAVITAFRNSGSSPLWVDTVTWDALFSQPPPGLIFKAVQATAGYSGAGEPIWPTVLGVQVIDNEVTWEAVTTSRVVWEAHPIMKSGSVEPTFPTTIGSTVPDGTVVWEASSGVITDSKCPHSKIVAIAASKIFAADRDIISFCATVNPLDWTTVNDAGYLPFGLQTYGSNPVAALGLYRANLIAFNSEGFQMWQVDQDPSNMALLDAVPVSCVEEKTPQPIANDLVFKSPVGVRNMNIAGASTNLQAGNFGEAIDPLVKEASAGGEEPMSISWPTAGQYWLVYGEEAFVLTTNSPKDLSWSRYVFPEAITDWTLHGSDLLLRTSTNKVWKMSADVLRDDVGTSEYRVTEDLVQRATEDGTLRVTEEDTGGGEGIPITGVIHWPFLDFSSPARDKELIGYDLVCTAPEGVTASVGYNQRDRDDRTDEFAADDDTVTGTLVPLPLTAPSFDLRLTFAPDQAWEWFAANLQIKDR